MKSSGKSKLIYEVAALKTPPFCQSTWLRPIITPSGGFSFAGGLASFDLIDVVMPNPTGGYIASRMSCDQLFASADDRNLASKALDKIVAVRPDFAGLCMERTHLMGILNVTPDSFFDGGVNREASRAIAAGKAMCGLMAHDYRHWRRVNTARRCAGHL